MTERYKNNTKSLPIEIAYNNLVIDELVKGGAIKYDASYTPGTIKHKANLQRIGYDKTQKNRLYLVECMKVYDLQGFVSLIGSGIDINYSLQPGRWTALHHIFAQADCESNSKNDDFIDICTKNVYLHFANILIHHKAKPLKDTVGRTPLMCMSTHANSLKYTKHIIDLYADYEADYYGLDRQEYKDKFCALRRGEYVSVPNIMCVGPTISASMKKVYDTFWESFRTHTETE